jgi:aminotransferase
MVEFRPAQRVGALPPNFFGAMDRRIAETAALAGPRVINVSKGNPDLPTPERIVAAMQGSVADPRNHGYPAYAPRPSVRDAIVHRYRVDHGVELDPEANLAIFHGSHEAFMAAVIAIADPGSTVVLPDPGYPIYDSAVGLAGAVSAVLPLIEPGYQPHFAALDALPGASALLLNYPNNPTGALAADGTFEGALAASERLGAAFIHDFAYASLGFDGRRPRSALAVDSGLERTVEVATLSKTYSMAGWRFGFAVGNASLIAAMRRYQSHAYSTIFGATQEAAAAALGGDQSAADDLVAVYERRRDRMVTGLRRLGWSLAVPEGTFFVWARVPDGGDDVEFAERLLEHARIAVAPGSGFGSRGRGWVRFGLVIDETTIDEVLDRLAAVQHDDRPCVGAVATEG